MEEERFWFRERGVERYVGDSFHGCFRGRIGFLLYFINMEIGLNWDFVPMQN